MISTHANNGFRKETFTNYSMDPLKNNISGNHIYGKIPHCFFPGYVHNILHIYFRAIFV